NEQNARIIGTVKRLVLANSFPKLFPSPRRSAATAKASEKSVPDRRRDSTSSRRCDSNSLTADGTIPAASICRRHPAIRASRSGIVFLWCARRRHFPQPQVRRKIKSPKRSQPEIEANPQFGKTAFHQKRSHQHESRQSP